MENWEESQSLIYPLRVNRRAVTGTVVKDNAAFSIRVLENGYGRYRSTWYYRRHLSNGTVFTGTRAHGLALNLMNAC